MELLTGAKKNCKNKEDNEETADHPWTASLKGRRRSLVCSQETERKGPDAVRRGLTSRNNNTVEYLDRKEGTLIQTVRTHQHNIN